MKTKSCILITILLIAFSCNKQPEVAQTPLLFIKFGNLENTNLFLGIKDTVIAENIGPVLPVDIFEYHLEQFNLKNAELELHIFAFQVITSADSEAFITGKNIRGISGGAFVDKHYRLTQVERNFEVPVKYSGRVIKDNDTIELRRENEYIKVQYRSGYSGRIVRKVLIIK
jgi:hypothetical protein